MMTDPKTGRPLGDHGTAQDAIDFILDGWCDMEARAFLKGWREGSLDEWPDYYEWLAKRPVERDPNQQELDLGAR